MVSYQMNNLDILEESVATIEMEEETTPKRMKTKVKYKQKYRPQWEQTPECRGWLSASLDSPFLGFCRICKTNVQAHKKDIYRHSQCKKHLKNKEADPTFADYDYALTKDEYRVVYDDDENLYMDGEDDEYLIYDDKPKKKLKFEVPHIKKEKCDPGFGKSSSGGGSTTSGSKEKQVVVEKCSRWCCQLPEAPPVYEDSHSTFGRFVSDELRNISDEYEKQKAKIKINTVIFQACVGRFNHGEAEEDKGTDDQEVQRVQLGDFNDDQMSSFGKYIGNEIRSIPSKKERQTVKQLICKIVYKASCRDESSVDLYIPNSPQHEQQMYRE